MDLEGIARKLYPDIEEIRKKLLEEITFYKGADYPLRDKLINSIIIEIKNSLEAEKVKEILRYPKTGIKAGEAGLGSRGVGDHLIHEKLLQLSNLKGFEDARVKEGIVVSVDGIHSRLAYFPFLAGFHATRAALRDIMVKGARPLGVIIDIHLSDDSDIGMLFDFEAGVMSVTDYLGIQILAGSTLRIGGDMVIGERISGGIAAVGVIDKKYFSRDNIREGMEIVMTEGNGGGTITTTAIYNAYYDVIDETINLKDLETCKMVNEELWQEIESMTDVTNGGIRATSTEIPKGLSLEISVKKFKALINPKVLKMLEELQIDPLGLSIDSILIFTYSGEKVAKELQKKGIRADVIGRVGKADRPLIDLDTGEALDMKFRESPYTPIKKVIGNYSPYSLNDLKKRFDEAFALANNKKERVLKTLKGS
jgi:hydrogenase expression/formation protein